MLRSRLHAWLRRGELRERLLKAFVFNAALAALVFTIGHGIGRWAHWTIFAPRPFRSEEFWVDCVCFGIGFAFVAVRAEEKRRQTCE